MIAKLKKPGNGYQTRSNRILREHMLEEMRGAWMSGFVVPTLSETARKNGPPARYRSCLLVSPAVGETLPCLRCVESILAQVA